MEYNHINFIKKGPVDGISYSFWRAAEIMLLEDNIDFFLVKSPTEVIYADPQADWPARGMVFTTGEQVNTLCASWNVGGSSCKLRTYFDADVTQYDIKDLVLSALRNMFDINSLFFAEVSGFIRLLAPFVLSRKDHGQFSTIMGYDISSLQTGTSPTGATIKAIARDYNAIIDELVPAGAVNALVNELAREAQMVSDLLKAIDNGWRFVNRGGYVRVSVPNGPVLEVNLRHFFHVAAKDPLIHIDIPKVVEYA